VLAWQGAEGDLSPSGTRVVSVIRNAHTARVRVGFSDETVLVVPRDRRVVVQVPRQRVLFPFLQAANRAREYLRRAAR